MIEKLNICQPHFYWYLSLPHSEFTDYILEAIKLTETYPDILDRIAKDLEIYALTKKQIRTQDKVWMLSQNQELPGINNLNNEDTGYVIELENGRPRKMTPLITYIFMMIRGYQGGIKECETTVFMQESATIQLILQNLGSTMPGRSTILENINAISEETRNTILDYQLQEAMAQQLDDFKELLIDSTTVAANSCYPRDSELIYNLVNRIYQTGKLLHRLGLKDIADWYFKKIIKKLRKYATKIGMESGKQDSGKKRRKWYRIIYDLADIAIKYFEIEIEKVTEQMHKINILPSQYERLTRMVNHMQMDLENLKKVRTYSYLRVIEDQQVSGKEKISSISDQSATFIQKGQRDMVIGYKPQLVRSGMGFITEIVVPEGNASDSGQFLPAIESSIERTQVIPDIVSADDGYPSILARQTLLEKGVKVVSFNGSKGKRITPINDWESDEYQYARDQRSAVESLMFTIKYKFDFGRVMRRGIDNVRAELLEKVLAYNFCRKLLIQRQLAERLAAA